MCTASHHYMHDVPLVHPLMHAVARDGCDVTPCHVCGKHEACDQCLSTHAFVALNDCHLSHIACDPGVYDPQLCILLEGGKWIMHGPCCVVMPAHEVYVESKSSQNKPRVMQAAITSTHVHLWKGAISHVPTSFLLPSLDASDWLAVLRALVASCCGLNACKIK